MSILFTASFILGFTEISLVIVKM